MWSLDLLTEDRNVGGSALPIERAELFSWALPYALGSSMGYCWISASTLTVYLPFFHFIWSLSCYDMLRLSGLLVLWLAFSTRLRSNEGSVYVSTSHELVFIIYFVTFRIS